MRVQLILTLTIAIACRADDVSTGIPLRGIAEPRVEVYNALLDTIFTGRRPNVILIQDSSVMFWYSAGHVPARLLAEFPEELLATLHRLSTSVRPLADLGVPPQWRQVRLAEIRGLFHTNPDIGWSNFHSRFPGTQGWLSVSPIAFSQDGSVAAVYFEWHCGSLCGRGDVALLRREGRGRWRVRHLLRYWVS